MNIQVGDYARNIESGWKGKIRRLYKHNDEQMAEMIGVDELVQLVFGKTDEECLSKDDIQFHAVADLLPYKTTEAI